VPYDPGDPVVLGAPRRAVLSASPYPALAFATGAGHHLRRERGHTSMKRQRPDFALLAPGNFQRSRDHRDGRERHHRGGVSPGRERQHRGAPAPQGARAFQGGDHAFQGREYSQHRDVGRNWQRDGGGGGGYHGGDRGGGDYRGGGDGGDGYRGGGGGGGGGGSGYRGGGGGGDGYRGGGGPRSASFQPRQGGGLWQDERNGAPRLTQQHRPSGYSGGPGRAREDRSGAAEQPMHAPRVPDGLVSNSLPIKIEDPDKPVWIMHLSFQGSGDTQGGVAGPEDGRQAKKARTAAVRAMLRREFQAKHGPLKGQGKLFREFVSMMILDDGTIISPIQLGDMGAEAVEPDAQKPKTERPRLRANIKSMRQSKVSELPLQVLNTIINRAQETFLFRIGRHFFNKIEYEHPDGVTIRSITAHSGFHTSVEAGFVLRVDPIFKVINKTTALQTIENAFKTSQFNWRRSVLGSEGEAMPWAVSLDDKTLARGAMLGRTVLCKHNHISYRVLGIRFEDDPRSDKDPKGQDPTSMLSTFRRKGVDISFQDYFADTYDGLKDLYTYQPFIRACTDRGTVWLPAQICWVCEVPVDARQHLPKMLSRKPRDRRDTIYDFARHIGDNGAQVLQPWGISVEEQLTPIVSRQLPLPRIMMCQATPQNSDNEMVVTKQPGGNFGPSTQYMKFGCAMANLMNVIVTCEDRHLDLAYSFTRDIRHKLEKAEAPVLFMEPLYVPTTANGVAGHIDAMQSTLTSNGLTAGGVFWLAFNTDGSAEQYVAMKQFSIKNGIDHQVVSTCGKDDRRKRGGILGGLTKQIINKSSAQLVWRPDITPCGALGGHGAVMVVGIAMCHSSTFVAPNCQKLTGKSRAAFVAWFLDSTGKVTSMYSDHCEVEPLNTVVHATDQLTAFVKDAICPGIPAMIELLQDNLRECSKCIGIEGEDNHLTENDFQDTMRHIMNQLHSHIEIVPEEVKDMMVTQFNAVGWNVMKGEPATKAMEGKPPPLRATYKEMQDFLTGATARLKAIRGRFLPAHCVVFREGVAENQVDEIKLHECGAINTAFKQVISETRSQASPTFVYVIINQDTKTRYLHQRNGNVSNPTPGTVVENTTNEFLLVPTKCGLSTAKPVRYIVVRNRLVDTGPTPSDADGTIPIRDLQAFVNVMCYCYPNWPGPVKVPFPVQCASKLAKLIYDMGSKPPKTHNRLKTKPYFL
jgi:hypothetical protein